MMRPRPAADSAAWNASRDAAGPGMTPFFGGVETGTFRRREQLLPGQIAQAEDLAIEILRNRSAACCTSLDVPDTED